MQTNVEQIQRDPKSLGTIDESGQVTGKIFFSGDDGKIYVGDLSGHYLAPTVSNVTEVPAELNREEGK